MGSVFLNAPAPTCSDASGMEKYMVLAMPPQSSPYDQKNLPFIMHLFNLFIICNV